MDDIEFRFLQCIFVLNGGYGKRISHEENVKAIDQNALQFGIPTIETKLQLF